MLNVVLVSLGFLFGIMGSGMLIVFLLLCLVFLFIDFIFLVDCSGVIFLLFCICFFWFGKCLESMDRICWFGIGELLWWFLCLLFGLLWWFCGIVLGLGCWWIGRCVVILVFVVFWLVFCFFWFLVG